MLETYVLENLETIQCSETSWKEVLEILKETKMDFWLTEKESPDEFYLVREPTSKKAICCFKFTQEGEIGILKNVAVRPNNQRKGVGTFIVNNIIPKVAKDRGIKKLYLLGNDRGPYTSHNFWKKTIYTQISPHEVKDKFFRDYFEYIEKNYSDDVFFKDSAFYLDLENWNS